nr:TetR/AcrR family transcriptional regulator [Sphingomonas sp. CDS-1]
MSTLSRGRINQKLRTRNALVDAAARLMRIGTEFSVAEVADLAQVGRTTAYRYFPNIDTLVAHAALYAITDVERRSIGAALDRASDAEGRLRAVIEAADHSVTENENLFRAMLRLSVESESVQSEVLPRRAGVRRTLLDTAIGSLKKELGKKGYDRLISALSMLVGIESLVVLRDVCQLSEVKARDVKLWAASALLNAALSQRGGERGAGAQKPVKASAVEPATRRPRKVAAGE